MTVNTDFCLGAISNSIGRDTNETGSHKNRPRARWMCLRTLDRRVITSPKRMDIIQTKKIGTMVFYECLMTTRNNARESIS